MPDQTLLVIVHTGPATVQPLAALAPELLPGVRVVNLVDDSLLKDTMTAGHVTPAVTRRLAQYMLIGQEMGATMLLNACSSVGEAADAVRPLLTIPMVKIDQAMAERAVAGGRRIGVAATVQTTLDPTARLIERVARASGRVVEVKRALCEGAFEALLAGRTDEHDAIVGKALTALAGEVDLIVLAQVSMGRVVEMAGQSFGVPVLTSPRMGMERVAESLRGRTEQAA